MNLYAADSSAPAWEQLYSPDPAIFAANLRSAGFPESTVGLLVSEQINVGFASRERKLVQASEADGNLRKFWEPAHRHAWLQLQREKNQALRNALGALPGVHATFDWLAAMFPAVSEEGRSAIRDISLDYQELEERVVAESKGHLLDIDLAMLAFLHEQQVADLRQFLTEDQIADFLIRRTRFGAQVRRMVECFDASAAERRDIYRAGVKAGLAVQSFQTFQTRTTEHTRPLDAELARLWPPERLAALQRTRRPSYQRTFHLVGRLQLSRTAADTVNDSYLRMLNALLGSLPSGAGMPKQFPLLHESGVPSSPGASDGSKLATKEAREKFVGQILETHLAEVRDALGEVGHNEYCAMNESWITRMRTGVAVLSEQP